MIRNCVLCEGATDFMLLQYFLRKVYGWEDMLQEEQDDYFKYGKGWSRTFSKDEKTVTIAETGGVSHMLKALRQLLEINQSDIEDTWYRKIIIFTDNDEAGALETFLLNSIKDKDSYEKEIIEKGDNFVESVDPEKKYLKHRKLVTKAKFDVYFSIRTPAKAFRERQDILKNIPWEKYIGVRKEFKKYAEL